MRRYISRLRETPLTDAEVSEQQAVDADVQQTLDRLPNAPTALASDMAALRALQTQIRERIVAGLR